MDSHQQKNKPKAVVQTTDNWIEQFRDIGRNIGQSVKTDLTTGIANDALSSLFGSPKSGDLQAGQVVKLTPSAPPSPSAESRPQMPFPFERNPFARFKREQFFTQYSKEALQKLQIKEAEVQKKIEEVRQELKALIATLKQVDREIVKAVDEQIIDPDLYHLTFLDRIKTILKLVRQNLSESRSWLVVMRSRKKERNYWALFKKKGTSFGLSTERVIATQVG